MSWQLDTKRFIQHDAETDVSRLRCPLFPFAVKEMSYGAVVVKCAHNFSSHPPKKIYFDSVISILLLWSKQTGKLRKTKHVVNLFKDEHMKTASPSVLLSGATRVGNNNFNKSCTHEPRLTPPPTLSYTVMTACRRELRWENARMTQRFDLDRIPRGCVG